MPLPICQLGLGHSMLAPPVPNAIAGSGSTTLTIFPSSVATAGVYTVTVKTYAGGTIATSTFQLTI